MMRIAAITTGTATQLHAVHMQLDFKDEPLHVRVAPSANWHKFHEIGSGMGLDAGKTHFNFEREVSVASKELFAANAWVQPVPYAHDLHNLRRLLGV